MIIKEETVPRLSLQLVLPFVHDAAEVSQLRLLIRPFSDRAPYEIHMLKLEDHSQLGAIVVCVFLCLFDRYACSFTNGEQIVMGEDTPVHFLKIFVDTRAVAYIGAKASIQSVFDRSVRKSRILGNHADNIHAKTIDSLLAPPVHHIEYFIADLWIFPVQIRLLLGKAVQIVHTGSLVKLPCGTAEAGSPVVRLLPILRLLPDVIIPVRIVSGAAAFDKPCMLIGGVVHDKIHDNSDMMTVCLRKQTVKILHRTEIIHDIAVIGNIVAVVIIGRFINRRQPDHINSERLQIIQMCGDSVQITDAVAVAVREAARINLINDGFLPPCFFLFCHCVSSFFVWLLFVSVLAGKCRNHFILLSATIIGPGRKIYC